MRSFWGIASRRHISTLLVLALVVPIFGAIFLPKPASAQANMSRVAVVDFRSTAKTPDDVAASMASDSIAAELMRSGKFDVASSDSLQDMMQKVGYITKEEKGSRVLLTQTMMQRLGQELGVESVVSGELVYVKVDKKEAAVRLSVKMLDVASGEYINGAVQTGRSHPRIGYSGGNDNELIVEAINDASRRCVDQMVQYIIPQATILGTYGAKDVLLNKGSQDGVFPGMKMIVTRVGEGGQDDLVAHIRVTTVTDTDAHAAVEQQTRGVKPEDHAKAVYEAPADVAKETKDEPREAIQARNKKSTSILWGIVGLVGLWALMGNGGSKDEEVPGGSVMAAASPDVTTSNTDGGIICVWNNPRDLATTNIIEYHIWRDNFGNFNDSAPSNFGLVEAPGQLSAIPWHGPTGSYDHSVIMDTTIWDPLSFNYPSADHTSLISASPTVNGITVGKTHKFWLSCLYKRISTTTGDISYWETTPVSCGQATFVNRPITVSPGDISADTYVDLSNITFEWQGSAGADTYVIEVSPSPDFKRSETWVSGTIYQPTTEDGATISRQFTGSSALSLSTELRSLTAGTPLYWRVGARNRADNPGPYPAGPSPEKKGSKNTRYIYSDPNQLMHFMTPGDVPPPPSESSSAVKAK